MDLGKEHSRRRAKEVQISWGRTRWGGLVEAGVARAEQAGPREARGRAGQTGNEGQIPRGLVGQRKAFRFYPESEGDLGGLQTEEGHPVPLAAG